MHCVFENVVRGAETDAQGRVFYGTYVAYQDEAVTNFMADLGYAWDADARDWDIHAVNVELTYHAAAGVRDRLEHALRVEAIRNSSLEFAYECRRAEDDGLLVDGTVTHVVVDDAGAPTRVPQPFREAVVAAQAEAPEPV